MTVSEWASHFAKKYPEQFEKAELQAAGQKNETNGLREIAARISSQTSRNAFDGQIEVDQSERPRKVRWQTVEAVLEQEMADLEPLNRPSIMRQHRDKYSTFESYRADEFGEIVRQLNDFFETDFELDHAEALLSKSQPGQHHPNNFQILIKSHNRKKSSESWKRFTFEEQIEYINRYVHFQKSFLERYNVDFDEKVFDSLVARLRNVF